MNFPAESLWGLLGYLAPGFFLGMGFALRKVREDLARAALPVGWGLLPASILVQGLGGAAPGRAFAFCLALDAVALGAFWIFYRSGSGRAAG